MISCSPWPPKSIKNSCKGNEGYMALDYELDITQTKECEVLCKLQYEDGCCYLGHTTGCHWKAPADIDRDFGGVGEDATTVKCYRHNGN